MLRSATDDCSLRRLRYQLLFEFGNMPAEIFDAATLFRQFLACVLELDSFGVAAVLDGPEFIARGAEPVLQHLDSVLERDDLEPLRIRFARAFVELSHELSEL